MGFISEIIGYPLGWVMWLCYEAVRNYGFALLLFTFFTRLIMIPFTVKQQKASAKMAMLKPQMDELQRRYAGNKEKLNEETMKLYNSNGYNPMSGCLPLLIQFPILFGLIDVIYKPLTYLVRIPKDVLQIGIDIAQANGLMETGGRSVEQLIVMRSVRAEPGLFQEMGADVIRRIQDVDLNFFGMDLTQTPSTGMFKELFTNPNLLLLIPILAGVTALLMSLVTMRQTAGTDTVGAPGAAGTMKGMMLTMPIFSVMIAFSVPAGVGLYWIYSNLLGMVQSMIMNKIYNPKEMAEKAKEEFARKQEEERLARLEAKRLAKEGKLQDQDKEKAMTQKEINRRKLAEARKRDAEKYGEVYVEVTDDDLK